LIKGTAGRRLFYDLAINQIEQGLTQTFKPPPKLPGNRRLKG